MSNSVAAAVSEAKSPGIATLEQVAGRLPAEGKDAGRWKRVYTREGIHPFDEIEWKRVDAKIVGPDGDVKFEQKGVEVPAFWNQTTVNVVVNKYFRMIDGIKETSAKQMFSRVASTVRQWAEEQNYFNTPADAEVYEHELVYALLTQRGAFNSPVWFNLGVPGRRQAASACFISGVEDTLDSIMDFAKSEKVIFAGGSGSGANMSKIRSSYEKLSSGAYVCGPVGWMEELDKGAKAMKSGGSTRNAAKMVVLDMDHPDILETKDGRPGFIRCKAVEEKRAHDLIDIGYSAAYDDPNSAYKWVSFQNANHSVSIPDAFMEAVRNDDVWYTHERVGGRPVSQYRARELWEEIAKAAWFCGDPGVQFTDTINKWHTTPNAGRINSSNPCSEFLHVDNTACNLCAVNLTKFFDGRTLNVQDFEHAIRLFVTAQNAIVAKADYPTDSIRENSLALRPIGLNYGDLGALLMKLGYGYDSDGGRAIAARLASLMTAFAYLTSAKLAARVGPFPEFKNNRDEMINIMEMHQKADSKILGTWSQESDPLGNDVMSRSREAWAEVIRLGSKFGYSISQATLQAPLGTISFLMGMDTTGIEPCFSLVSYKSLVGGGFEKLTNGSVRASLSALGYPDATVDAICTYMQDHDFIEGAPGFRAEHLPIFDCAMPLGPSKRCLSPLAHLKMMAAIQPLITCAQSKTVNMPPETTPEEIADTYMKGWELGLKCIALYRDGCKKSQPLATKKRSDEQLEKNGDPYRTAAVVEVREVVREVTKRRHMPEDCVGRRHRFEINGHKGYIIVNEFPDGTPGEVFLRLGKSGSTMEGTINGFTQLLSIALQYGVPLDKLIRSFVNTRFDPSGFTRNPKIRMAQSIFDYLFKHLDLMYYGGEHSGLDHRLDSVVPPPPPSSDSEPPSLSLDAPPCPNCGGITRRNGSCYLCDTCGSSTGCS